LAAPATTTARPTRAVNTSAMVAALCLSGTVVALQQTLVVPLLPDFPEILGTTTGNASWLVTSTRWWVRWQRRSSRVSRT
jgi:predicted MFS family arabinose efflux permease